MNSFGIGFLGNNPLALIGLATVLYWLGLSYHRSEARKVREGFNDGHRRIRLTWRLVLYQLRHIPSVGPTFPILSYAGTFKFCKDAQSVVEMGIQKVCKRYST